MPASGEPGAVVGVPRILDTRRVPTPGVRERAQDEVEALREPGADHDVGPGSATAPRTRRR